MAVTGESVDSNNRSCAMLTAKGVREAAQYYLGDADPRDPRHSPLYADLTGLPPQLIFASTDEVLRDDSTRFAAKAREQGVEVELHLVRGVPHAASGRAPPPLHGARAAGRPDGDAPQPHLYGTAHGPPAVSHP